MLVPDTVRSETGQFKMKLVAQQRVLKKASDAFSDSRFDSRMQLPDKRGGLRRVPGLPGLHAFCFLNTSSSLIHRPFRVCLSERRMDRIASESLRTSIVSKRPSYRSGLRTIAAGMPPRVIAKTSSFSPSSRRSFSSRFLASVTETNWSICLMGLPPQGRYNSLINPCQIAWGRKIALTYWHDASYNIIMHI